MTSPRRFFIIGAQRSGTSLLHRILAQHPDIAMNEPVRPEPRSFLDPSSAVLDVGAHDRRLFAHAESVAALGEKSTTYIEHPDVGARVLSRFPDAAFLVMVRDPVDRAFSNYDFTAGHGLEQLPPERALTVEAEARPWRYLGTSTSPFHYLRRGKYVDQLERWARVVGRDRLLVVALEELPRQLDTVQRFVGVEPWPEIAVPPRVNASSPVATDEERDRLRPVLGAHFRPYNIALAERWPIRVDDWS